MQGQNVSNRQTDTEKWANPWFRKLSPKGKLLWMYMLDNCDCGGVWKEDLELVGFQIGAQVSVCDLAPFEGKVLRLNEDTLFIKAYPKFQAGLTDDEKLNPANPYHKGIIRCLKDAGINPDSLLPSSIQKLIPDPEPDPDPKGLARVSEVPWKPLHSPTKEEEGERERERGEGNGKENAEGILQIPARARDVGEDVSVAVDPAPAQSPALVARAIDRELGLEASPLPADPPAPDNVITGPWPPQPALAMPTPADTPPAGSERRMITPVKARTASSAPPGAHKARGYFVASDYDGPPTVAPCEAIRQQLGMALRRPVTHERQEASA